MEIFTENLLNKLPAESRAKAIRLDEEREAAYGALRLAMDSLDAGRDRLEAARRASHFQKFAEDGARRRLTEEELASVEAPVRRVEAEIEERLAPRARRAEDAWHAHNFLSTSAAWLSDLPAGTRLRHFPLPTHKGDPARVVEECRRELDRIDVQFSQIERAPRPVADLRAALIEEVDRLAAAGAPRCDPRIRAGSPVKVADAFGLRGQGDNLAALAHAVVWSARELILEKALALLPAADLPGALSDAARDAAIDKLAAERIEIERREEAAIKAAAAAGTVIARRIDADPRAVLELGA